MGLFKPIWMRKYLNYKQVDKVKWRMNRWKGKKLIKAAMKAQNPEIREKAVRMLSDQGVLTEIARKDRDEWVRRDAVEKLTDQAVLAEIARKDIYSDVREAAVRKLTDQALLAEIALKDEKSDIRETAAIYLTDQTALAEIALKDDGKVSIAAAKNLTEQTLLARVARGSVYAGPIAYGKLTGEIDYADLARNAKASSVREDAAKKTTDQTQLAEIAMKDQGAGYAAYQKLTGEIHYADYARNAKNAEVRQAALKKVTDQAVVAEIAMKETNEAIRLAAVEMMTDREALKRIADWKKGSSDRIHILKRMAVLGDDSAVDSLLKYLDGRRYTVEEIRSAVSAVRALYLNKNVSSEVKARIRSHSGYHYSNGHFDNMENGDAHSDYEDDVILYLE